MDELISVIVPIYKVEQYLDRCLSSIVHQSYRNLEIILVDDGSPDQCPQLCDDWADKDNRIRVIHKANGGLSSARNTGLDIASGNYIAFVDSDDYISENMLETMLSAALRNNVPVACCGRVRVSETSKFEMFISPKELLLTGEDAIKELLIGGIVEEAAWDKLYRYDVFENRRFPVGEINEDIVQTIEILGSCKHIVHVGKALYYYCENQNSITTSKYTSRKKICIKHLNEIELYLKRLYPQLIESYYILELRYCQCLLYLLLDNREALNNNRVDYDEVLDRFRKVFRLTRYGKGVNNIDRMKGFLIYYKCYFLLHLVFKR